MRVYEMMVIFHPDVDDAGVKGHLEQITSGVEAGDGTIATTDVWGKRRFAYEINHLTEGIYVVLEIVTEATDLHDVERQLRLADEVIRHKVIRLPDHEAQRRGLLGETAPA